MNIKDGNYRRYFELAATIVQSAEDDGRRVTTSLLADDMYRRVDPDILSPEIVQYGCRQFCVQILGKVCRDKWGTVNDPAGDDFKKQMEFKEFGTRLQARYPVPAAEGETEYKHIDALSEVEVAGLCKKMHRIGDGYHEAADQLKRYHRQKDGTVD